MPTFASNGANDGTCPAFYCLKRSPSPRFSDGGGDQKANRLYLSGDASGAIVVLEEWRTTEPSIEPGDSLLLAHGQLGHYYAAANRMEEAAPLLLQALTFYEKPDNRLVTANQSAANIHDQLARYSTQKAIWRKN